MIGIWILRGEGIIVTAMKDFSTCTRQLHLVLKSSVGQKHRLWLLIDTYNAKRFILDMNSES